MFSPTSDFDFFRVRDRTVDLPRKLEHLADVLVEVLLAQASLWAKRYKQGRFARQIARWRRVDGNAVTTPLNDKCLKETLNNP